jgi:hypothetical protein
MKQRIDMQIHKKGTICGFVFAVMLLCPDNAIPASVEIYHLLQPPRFFKQSEFETAQGQTGSILDFSAPNISHSLDSWGGSRCSPRTLL